MAWQCLVIWTVSIQERISQGSIFAVRFAIESYGVNVRERALRREGDTGLYLLITFV